MKVLSKHALLKIDLWEMKCISIQIYCMIHLVLVQCCHSDTNEANRHYKMYSKVKSRVHILHPAIGLDF